MSKREWGTKKMQKKKKNEKEKEIRSSAVEIEWYAKRKKKYNREINNNPQPRAVSNSVELSVRFLVPCFYANICETLEGSDSGRDKRRP